MICEDYSEEFVSYQDHLHLPHGGPDRHGRDHESWGRNYFAFLSEDTVSYTAKDEAIKSVHHKFFCLLSGSV
jgi:hypothetical protein